MVQVYGLCSCERYPAPVPLEGVHVEAKVVDMVAQVSVVQYYVNNSNKEIECRYIFPLDSYSAVCAFEAEINGEIIVGKVQEKQKAKEEYNKAIARGDGAYLLEETKADIFEVKVGNIPPHTRVNIWITYITELKIEADESTRFLLPTTVAPRYSPSSSSSSSSSSSDSSIGWGTKKWFDVFERRFSLPFRYRKNYEEIPSFIQPFPHSFSVMVEIESPSLPSSSSDPSSDSSAAAAVASLVEVISPSHPGLIHVERTSEKTCFVSFIHGNERVGKDFILDYKIKEPHTPRAIIEKENEEAEEVAAMVTLVPSFTLTDVKSELIFLIDRSGSMEGKFIEQAKEGLQLFLRALPVDCYINIIGFGSRFTKLFKESKKYSQKTLNKATNHVNGISADMGGTELKAPLEDIFRTPMIGGYSRNIFVLTDGQVSNTEEIFKLIRKNNLKKGGRVFALGVGDQVSHDLVEGIARAGRGNARFIVDGQRMDSIILRQLKDSLQPSLTEVSIDWGFPLLQDKDDNQNDDQNGDQEGDQQMDDQTDDRSKDKNKIVKGSLIGHRSDDAKDLLFPSPLSKKQPRYYQTPNEIPPIFSGTRFIAYAFLKRKKGESSPPIITVTAQSPDGPLSLQLKVENHSGNLVQKLTARSMIRDLEEGSSWLHSSPPSPSSSSSSPSSPSSFLSDIYNVDELAKEEIIRLATKFSLASKFTSFIAIENRNCFYQSRSRKESFCSFTCFNANSNLNLNSNSSSSHSFSNSFSSFNPNIAPVFQLSSSNNSHGGGRGGGRGGRGGRSTGSNLHSLNSNLNNNNNNNNNHINMNYFMNSNMNNIVDANCISLSSRNNSYYNNNINLNNMNMNMNCNNDMSNINNNNNCLKRSREILSDEDDLEYIQTSSNCIINNNAVFNHDNFSKKCLRLCNNNINNNDDNNNYCNNNVALEETFLPQALKCNSISNSFSNCNSNAKLSKKSAKSVTKDSILQSIILLQQFDGSFVIDSKLAQIAPLFAESKIARSIPNSIASLAVDHKKVWVTLLIIQYLNLTLSELQSSWEMIVDKSKLWLKSVLNSTSDLNSLLDEALAYLKSKGY